MNKLRYALTICSLILVSLTFTVTIAHAQTAQRTFVSTSGSDANTASLCSVANPCRGFAAAISVVSLGGEVVALTSGGYGTVEITKSVQIIAPTGVYAAITAVPANAIGGTDAIRVNAGSSDIVVIKGLTLNNVGTTNANGITFPSGARLYVENCVINGFDNNGISIDRSAAGSPEVFVTDTVIRNGGASGTDAGIFLRQASGGLIRAMIDNCRLERAGLVGLYATDYTRTTVRNTVAARNTYGFIVAATTGTMAELTLENCTATLSPVHGIVVGDLAPFSGGKATAHISNSSVNGNSDDGIFINRATAYISNSTISNNLGDGIDFGNISSAYVAFTTISGNGGKGLNRKSDGEQPISLGNNRVFNNTGGGNFFSANIGQL